MTRIFRRSRVTLPKSRVGNGSEEKHYVHKLCTSSPWSAGCAGWPDWTSGCCGGEVVQHPLKLKNHSCKLGVVRTTILGTFEFLAGEDHLQIRSFKLVPSWLHGDLSLLVTKFFFGVTIYWCVSHLDPYLKLGGQLQGVRCGAEAWPEVQVEIFRYKIWKAH